MKIAMKIKFHAIRCSVLKKYYKKQKALISKSKLEISAFCFGYSVPSNLILKDRAKALFELHGHLNRFYSIKHMYKLVQRKGVEPSRLLSIRT